MFPLKNLACKELIELPNEVMTPDALLCVLLIAGQTS